MIKNNARPNIGLGTVQFGVPYGVHSSEPLIEKSQVFTVLTKAIDLGIKFFDTAANYGESENRLGEYFNGKNLDDHELNISTKIPRVEKSVWNSSRYLDYIMEVIKISLLNLNIKSIKLLQFHQCDLDFLHSKNVKETFNRLLEENICSRIGISVYTPEQAFAALDIPFVQTLQIPLNILDRRFVTFSLLEKYNEKNIFLIARSILLQGILVPNISLPNVKRKELLLNLRKKCLLISNNLNLHKIAIDFIFNYQQNINIALIGVNTVEELVSNYNFVNSPSLLNERINNLFIDLGNEANEIGLLDPSKWNDS